EMNRYGLLRTNGTQKPSYLAFRDVAMHGDQLNGACGDFSGPAIKVNQPTPNMLFADHLMLSATASDPDGIHRISFLCDGKKISTFGGENMGTSHTSTMTWYGSSKLPNGPHVIEVQSTDLYGNLSQQDIPIVKVDPSKLPLARTWVQARVRGHGLVRTVTGRVYSNQPTPVRRRCEAPCQVLSGKKWVSRHRVSKNASKPCRVVQHLARPGRWRVQIKFRGGSGFKASSAPSRTFFARG